MMKKPIALLLLSTCTVFAQREIQFQQYLYSPMAINPAMAGTSETFRLNATFRRQYIQGVQGLPLSQTFSMDGKVGGGDEGGRRNNSGNFWGLGLQGIIDRTGPINNTGIYTNVAYHFQISEGERLSVGTLLGVAISPLYAISTSGLGASQNKARGSLGLGVNYDSDVFWAGLSMPEIWGSVIGDLSGYAIINYPKPIFLHSGLYMTVSDDLRLRPSVLISQKGEFHLNAQALYQDKLTAALSYRSVKIGTERYGLIYGLLTYNINKNIMAGYSYSSKVVEYITRDRGIHELTFTFTPNPKD